MKQFYRLCGVWGTALFLAFSASAQSTYYVRANASGSNDGTSWANAFTDLQSAIDAAVSGDQIWVAAGMYKPSKDMTGSVAPVDARTKTFVIKNGVKFYGGFAGTETALSQRNDIINPTVLSGDINGDDGSNFANNGENVYHVLVANALTTETVLDGFIITGGNANLTSAFLGMSYGHQYGGGLISSQVNTNLSVTHCIFRGNYAGFGGGAMQLYYSAPTINGCVYTDNSVSNSYGGAIYFDHGSPVIANSVFANNRSNYEGGALYVFNFSSPVIANSTFIGNYANTNGGAVYVRNSCTVNIKNSIIWSNTGGGAQAIANEGTATINVTYSDVQGGHTGTGNINVDPAFNHAMDADGADNRWRTADDGLVLRAGAPTANTGSNAAIPVGITTDIIGDARILNTTVNMGAYETLLPAMHYYVRAAASGSNDGSSWSNAFTNLQSALDLAVSGDQIWVAAGTYRPSKDMTGSASPADPRTKTFLIRNGVKLYGGFAGTETTLSQRNEIVNVTVLSGDMNGNDGGNFANNGENVYHVMVANLIVSPTVLDGFIITGGNANLTSGFLGMSYGHQYGGGLVSSQVNTNLSVTRCVFRGNYAGFGGGAMQLHYSAPAITSCIFTGNSVSNSYGGAIYFDHGSPVIANSVFAGNRSQYQGGAFYVFNFSNPVIINSTFRGNAASVTGGAVYVRDNCTVNIKNSIIWGNTGGGSQAIAHEDNPVINVTYSDVQGGYAGTGNINTDPAFANGTDPDGQDNVWFTPDDGLALLNDSPAANTGSNALIPGGITTDILGDNRILNTTVNMGAYELLRLRATVIFSNTATTFDGTPKYVSATTDPASLPVIISYRQNGNEVIDPIAVGTYQVTALIDHATYSGMATGVLNISKATASIHFANLIHTYDGLGKSADVTTTPSGLDVRVVYSSNGEEVSPINAGTYEVTATIQDDNYRGAVVETLTINKALALLTVSGLDQVYDGAAKTVTVASVPADLEGITLTFKQDGNTVLQPVNAGSYDVEANLENVNYQASTLNKTLVIARTSQSITFGALAPRTYGDAPLMLEATASSGAPVSYASSNTAVATVSGNQLTIVGVGTAVITAIQAGNQNYEAAATVERTLTVSQKQQAITFDVLQERTMGETAFSIEAIASSGLPVTLTSSNPAVATVNGNTVTLVGAGITVIRASQGGDDHYASAASVERTLTVRKRIQAITFSPLAEKILGEAAFQLSATVSSGLPISYESSNPAVATVVGNTVTLHGEGETTITALQQGDAQFEATQVSQKLIVRLVTGIEAGYDNAVKVYPNPVIDQVTIESTGSPDNIFSVLDFFGKVVLTLRPAFSEGQRHTLDLGTLAGGVYYLRVNTGKGMITKRIVKK